MAKKKKRIPKEIGGVKVPKELRRTGEAILDTVVTKANSPEGKAMIAGGLSMAATALMAAAERQRARPQRANPGPDAPGAANDAAPRPGLGGVQGDRVGEVVGEAVDKVLASLFGKRAG